MFMTLLVKPTLNWDLSAVFAAGTQDAVWADLG